MGYGPTERHSIKAQCAACHGLTPFKKPNAITIDVHWTINPIGSPFTVNLDELWERARPCTIDGLNALALSPEDLLFHLCLHTTYQPKLQWNLRHLWDIPETITYFQDEIDWERLFRRTRQWGANKPVFLALYFARELLGATVPVEQRDRIKPDGFDSQVITWAKEQIFEESKVVGKPVFTSPFFAKLWDTRPFREKVVIFLKRVFPPPEFMERTYFVPSRSIQMYLFYLIRLKDLMVRFGPTTWRLWRGDKRVEPVRKNLNRKTTLIEWMESN